VEVSSQPFPCLSLSDEEEEKEKRSTSVLFFFSFAPRFSGRLSIPFLFLLHRVGTVEVASPFPFLQYIRDLVVFFQTGMMYLLYQRLIPFCAFSNSLPSPLLFFFDLDASERGGGKTVTEIGIFLFGSSSPNFYILLEQR